MMELVGVCNGLRCLGLIKKLMQVLVGKEGLFKCCLCGNVSLYDCDLDRRMFE